MKIYLIHESLKFNPQMHTFEFISGEAKRISLSVPASLCLSCILQNQGEVVSYDELMEKVWASRGMQVSLNTVYQNISILRRTFERYGLPSTVIQTISRKGIMFSAFITVQEMASEIHTSVLQRENNEHKTSENDGIQNNFTSVIGNSTEDGVQVKADHGFTVFSDQKKKVFINTENFFILILGITVTGFLLFSGASLSQKSKTLYSFTDYSMAGRQDGCVIVSNKSADKNFVIHTFSEIDADCDSQKWIYATNYPDTGKISFLTCKYQFSEVEEQFCESYYLEKKK